MKCSVCRMQMICYRSLYHYTESGLKHVYLEDVETCQCQCGETLTNIPVMPHLNHLVGTLLIQKNALLGPNEIRFIRETISMPIELLSDQLEADIEQIKLWEAGQRMIDKKNDRLLRLIFSNIKGLTPKEMIHLIDEPFFNNISEDNQESKLIIPKSKWMQKNNSCLETLIAQAVSNFYFDKPTFQHLMLCCLIIYLSLIQY